MSETKRLPIGLEDGDIVQGSMIAFDDDHSHMDIIRYMLSDNMTKEQLKHMVEVTDE